MAIIHQIRRKYATKNEEIIGELANSNGALSASDPKAILKRKAAEVAYLMALINGGEWKVRIDHEEGLVMIARRGGRRTL